MTFCFTYDGHSRDKKRKYFKKVLLNITIYFDWIYFDQVIVLIMLIFILIILVYVNYANNNVNNDVLIVFKNYTITY